VEFERKAARSLGSPHPVVLPEQIVPKEGGFEKKWGKSVSEIIESIWVVGSASAPAGTHEIHRK
jgi:hypothetical protein